MIKISLYKRLLTVYGIIGKTFGSWFSPIITGLLLLILRTVVLIGSIIDYICFSKIRKGKISNPILIVGNPRSGTTFLHHYNFSQVRNRFTAMANVIPICCVTKNY